MTLVDVTTGEVVAKMAPTDARALTDQIKVAVDATWQLIAAAYQGRAWAALGYSSWDDYCTREFGAARLRLPREDRQEVVASLRQSGLSLRAIATATGESKDTVARTLRATVANETVAAPPATADEAWTLDVEPTSEGLSTPIPPRAVVGVNGKTYRAPEPKPALTPEERREQDVAEAIARYARQLIRFTDLWPYMRGLPTSLLRDDVLDVLDSHTREVVLSIEKEYLL